MLRRSLTGLKSASPSLDQQMKLYTVAALAAGVGVLALAQPAESEVVVTKKTIPIPVSQFDGPQNLVPISLNNNGINDFSFSLYSFAYHSAFRELRIFPVEGGAVVSKVKTAGETPLALALVRGAKIGPSAHFSSDNNTEIEGSHANFGYTRSGKSYYNKTSAGYWGGNAKNRYIGVKFLINGQTHYGWVRLTVTIGPHTPIAATITAYAYETVANKVIKAGTLTSASSTAAKADVGATRSSNASLGMLALGSDGLPLWRREDSFTSN